MSIYPLFRKLLFKIDPELAHNISHHTGSSVANFEIARKALKKLFVVQSPALVSELFRTQFINPVGLAAGFDKNGTMPTLMEHLGFGFLEVGSVSYHPATGNPKPRLFRLPEDGALINRMGLNNVGAEEVLNNLKKHYLDIPVGINIVKTNRPNIFGDDAIQDIVKCFEVVRQMSDFIVVNVSCPNTEDGKTFEDPIALKNLLSALLKSRDYFGSIVPILVKFSADLSIEQLSNLIELACEYSVDGFVLTNTSLKRDGLKTNSAEIESMGKGGLSGKPIYSQMIKKIKAAYKLTKGKKVLIAVGGIDSSSDAYDAIKSGASLVELYTGLVYEGPGLIKRINKGLLKYLERDGLNNIKEAVGVDVTI